MRGSYRGGFRGVRGGFSGPGYSSGPGYPMRPPPFDIHIANDIFERVAEHDETQLTQKLEEIREVGSYKKDTALHGHTVADITVVMNTLPTFESVAALGGKISEELRVQKEALKCLVVSCVSRDFGCLLAGTNAQVRILITTLPSNAPNLEPDLHLSEKIMMTNHHAIRHAVWFEEASAQSPIKVA
uniref:DZF domain-containing protein n=1 Tax=Heterorhabditis bacteriophora TaxID=37862 RepID=A0A1I7WCN8_HETBA